MLERLASHQALELPGLPREGSTCLLPGLQELLVACDDESAQACLEVDRSRLECVRGDELLPEVASRLRGIVEVVDREKHRDEAANEDDRDEAARNRHPAGQAAAYRRHAHPVTVTDIRLAIALGRAYGRRVVFEEVW
jgi:hypothetical protein